jgi:hypothetical protein
VCVVDREKRGDEPEGPGPIVNEFAIAAGLVVLSVGAGALLAMFV